MEKQLFFMGAIVEFYNSIAYHPDTEKFILAECQEEGYVFQIICISGYNSGSISGYVKTDHISKVKNKKAISYKHLIQELKRNFGKINIETLKIHQQSP